MNNKEILNEFFGSKNKSYAQQRDEKLPTYNRVDNKGGTGGNNGLLQFDTKDVNEIKNRLTRVTGAAIGNQSTRSMANKSMKTVQVIVSEEVDPQTVVTLKKHIEVQYAEYLNQIISNLVIDITGFDRDTDNNIAIQAIDKVLGNNERFSRQNIAARAMGGKLSIDDVAGGNNLYNLFRKESTDFSLLPEAARELLEGAIIVESGKENEVVEYLLNESDYLTEGASFIINEANNSDWGKNLKNQKGIRHQLDRVKVAFEKLTTEQRTKISTEYQGLRRQLEGLYNGNWTPANKVSNLDTAKLALDKLSVLIMDARRNANPAPGGGGGTGNPSDADNFATHLQRNVQTASPYGLGTQSSAFDEKLRKKTALDLHNRGFGGINADGSEVYNRLTTSAALTDDSMAQAAMNKSVGDMLLAKENWYIKDRFEKASYLVASLKISGNEYVTYVTERLGLPVHKTTRQDLLHKFPAGNVIDDNGMTIGGDSKFNKGSSTTKLSKKVLKSNAKDIENVVAGICSTPSSALISTGAGVGAGLATLGLVAVIPGINIGALVGGSIAAVGAGTGFAVKALIDKIKMSKMKAMSTTTYQSRDLKGWRRVEALINDMDDKTFDFKMSAKYHTNRMSNKNVNAEYENKYNVAKTIDGSDITSQNSLTFKPKRLEINVDVPSGRDVREVRDGFERSMDRRPNQRLMAGESYLLVYGDTSETILELQEMLQECYDEVMANEETLKLIQEADLQEKIMRARNVTSPTVVSKHINYNDNEMNVLPAFGTKNTVAYGSVEIDRREVQSRMYNMPLVLTVKFKERYSDGRSADNELCAVIGVLAKVTRVPTEEMKHILRMNAQGSTVKGIFSGMSSGSVNDIFAKLNANDLKKTSQSADVWMGLEKVRRASITNQMAGKSNNNIANAHIIFAQSEIDTVRQELGVDYTRDKRISASLMKRYAAMTLMIANDNMDRVFIFDDIDANSWDVVPYSALRSKEEESLHSANVQMQRLR